MLMVGLGFVSIRSLYISTFNNALYQQTFSSVFFFSIFLFISNNIMIWCRLYEFWMSYIQWNDFESDKLKSNLEVSINFSIYDYEMNDLKDLLIFLFVYKTIKDIKNYLFSINKINIWFNGERGPLSLYNFWILYKVMQTKINRWHNKNTFKIITLLCWSNNNFLMV